MRACAPTLALALALSIMRGEVVHAVVFGGGGSPSSDCLAVFDGPVNSPASRPRSVRCVDGDPACDGDATVNGQCQFPIRICANSTVDPRCTLNGVTSIVVDHALDNGDPKFDPDFQALQLRIDSAIDPSPGSPATTPDQCTIPAAMILQVQGPLAGACRRARKQIKVTTESVVIAGRIYRDVDRLSLTCDPAPITFPPDPTPSGCDPLTFFSGTFDRIQQQIFNQSCAKSACHDSQSHQQSLVLEPGAAYTNLIDVTPATPDAAAAGWKRITSTGDPATSFVYRKVTGDLPSALGDLGRRMPRTGPKLHDDLVNVILLWIQAGAPQTGWVEGTCGTTPCP